MHTEYNMFHVAALLWTKYDRSQLCR